MNVVEKKYEDTDLGLMYIQARSVYEEGKARSSNVQQPLAQHVFGQFLPHDLDEVLQYRSPGSILEDIQWANRFQSIVDALRTTHGVDLWLLSSTSRLVNKDGLEGKILELWNQLFLSGTPESPAIGFIKRMEGLLGGQGEIASAIAAVTDTVQAQTHAVLVTVDMVNDRLNLLTSLTPINTYFRREKREIEAALGYQLFAPPYRMIDATHLTIPHIVSSSLRAVEICQKLRSIFDAMKKKNVDVWKIFVTEGSDLSTIPGLLVALFHSLASSPHRLIGNLQQTFVEENLTPDQVKQRLRFFLGLDT